MIRSNTFARLAAVSFYLCGGTVHAASDDAGLLAEIFHKLIAPTDRAVYAQDAENLAARGVDWRDVADYSSSCQVQRLRRDASRADLEIIHYIWVKNAGNEDRAGATVTRSIGQASYKSAVEAYAGGAFDCQFDTLAYIKKLSSK